jgi:hypothetical protein
VKIGEILGFHPKLEQRLHPFFSEKHGDKHTNNFFCKKCLPLPYVVFIFGTLPTEWGLQMGGERPWRLQIGDDVIAFCWYNLTDNRKRTFHD